MEILAVTREPVDNIIRTIEVNHVANNSIAAHILQINGQRGIGF
jgi:hypothetical protein